MTGTPTDCVIMAAKHLMPDEPDLVLSGVNAGQNVCDDVSYSGTVAGAIEGMMLGYRSIALSQSFRSDGSRELQWSTAERHGAAVIRKLLAVSAPEGTLFNVNFPAVEPDAVKGTKVTRQGKLDYALGIEERQDGRGLPYFWLKFGRQSGPEMDGSDLAALREGFISVTPCSSTSRTMRCARRCVPSSRKADVVTDTAGDREGLAALLMRVRSEDFVAGRLMEAVEAIPRRVFVPEGTRTPMGSTASRCRAARPCRARAPPCVSPQRCASSPSTGFSRSEPAAAT